MREKIYVYNVTGKTLHIKGFCHNSSAVGNETFETEDEAIKAKGKHIKMCEICESKKEEILQAYVKKSKKNEGI